MNCKVFLELLLASAWSAKDHSQVTWPACHLCGRVSLVLPPWEEGLGLGLREEEGPLLTPGAVGSV